MFVFVYAKSRFSYDTDFDIFIKIIMTFIIKYRDAALLMRHVKLWIIATQTH